METRLLVKIDCNGEFCGDCISKRFESYGDYCGIYNCPIKNKYDDNDNCLGIGRCKECIEAELKQ